MPSLSYNGEIITESAVVAQFLADAYPSHLVPTSSEEGGALKRARIAFFVDACEFFSLHVVPSLIISMRCWAHAASIAISARAAR